MLVAAEAPDVERVTELFRSNLGDVDAEIETFVVSKMDGRLPEAVAREPATGRRIYPGAWWIAVAVLAAVMAVVWFSSRA